MEKLSEHFRNALKEHNLDGKDDSTKKNKESADAKDQADKIKKEVAEKLKSLEENQKKFDSKTSMNQTKETKKPDLKKKDRERDKIKALNSTQQNDFLHKLIHRLIAQALRTYSDSASFNSALGQLQTTLTSLSGENQTNDTIRQSAAEVKHTREGLESYQVQYRNLEGLGLSLLKTIDGGGHDSLRKVHFISDALTALGKKTPLTDDEQRVLDVARRVISFASGAEKPSDKDFCEAFLRQLVGPLSRKVVLDKFKVEASKDGYDFGGMAKAIRAGQYNDLLVHSGLSPYMNLLLNTSMKPKDRLEPNGHPVTVNEKDPTLEQAQELDNFHAFQRDGNPTRIDLQRFLSGDMLQNTHRDDQIKNDPKTLHPKKVSFVLYDVSGSMGEKNKYVLRNALVLAYLDKSQKEVQAGQAEHIIYLMAFDGQPHKPERIQGISQAQAAFERMRQHPLTYGGNDSITGALVDVYHRIAQQQAEGGELNRANILLLTDAIAPVEFAQIEAARGKISKDVDVRLNAITMGDLNKDVTKLIELAGGEGKGKLGLVAHQHIDYTQVQRLLDTTARVEILNKTSNAFSSSAQKQMTNTSLIELKNKLVGLETRRSNDDNTKLAGYQGLIRRLVELGEETQNEVLTPVFKQYQRLALQGVSGSWTRAEKLESIWTFATDFGRETGADGESVIAQLSESQRETLRKWLAL